MPGHQTRIRSVEGPQFGCYVAMPDARSAVPAVVLASAIHGVDKDLRNIADEFASRGYIAAAPDLFWRTHPGALAQGDPRAAARAQPRLETIRIGEQDLTDVLTHLGKLPLFNGRAVVIGFCYGGPYAILGPKRLGYEAGLAFHGSQMRDYLLELEGVKGPVCVLWGDQDHLAPADIRAAYEAVAKRTTNLDVRVFAGVRHGYMLKSNAGAFDPTAFAASMACALAILRPLRSMPPG